MEFVAVSLVIKTNSRNKIWNRTCAVDMKIKTKVINIGVNRGKAMNK